MKWEPILIVRAPPKPPPPPPQRNCLLTRRTERIFQSRRRGECLPLPANALSVSAQRPPGDGAKGRPTGRPTDRSISCTHWNLSRALYLSTSAAEGKKEGSRARPTDRPTVTRLGSILTHLQRNVTCARAQSAQETAATSASAAAGRSGGQGRAGQGRAGRGFSQLMTVGV